MKTLQYKCKLLSDVILNMKSATEGNNETLDFIPGNNFLGIAARELYRENLNEDEKRIAWEIFHSGNVRFGDAHPCAADCNVRSLHTPAEFYYPKNEKETNGEVYVHFRIPKDKLEGDYMLKKQLKQCRRNYYSFCGNEGWLAENIKTFVIKSAYDREARRSKDEQMFGYESLCKGLELLFEVEVDDEGLAGKINDALVGEKHIGRSRTAQYGLVEISECHFENSKSAAPKDNMNAVFADGRLIFLDENGEPSFRPTAEQLGFGENDEIIWEKSQIRTFQYSPWNGKRHAYDTDRCGIEKGSVIIVKSSEPKVGSAYVGYYKNEGFGKVIYNPNFLTSDENGRATVTLKEKREYKQRPQQEPEPKTALLKYIRKQLKSGDINDSTYKVVNNFIKEKGDAFTPTDFDREWGKIEKFSSQWGTIRSIAASCSGPKDLHDKLFGTVNGYIKHGIAKEKWEQRNRAKLLEEFYNGLSDADRVKAVINLASEMAKYCKNKED